MATGSTHVAACPPRTATSPALSSPSSGPHSAPKSVSQLARTTPRPSGPTARGSEADEGARVPTSAPVESRHPPPGARRPLRPSARWDEAKGESSRFEGEGRRGRRGDSAGDPRKRGADRSSGGYHNCPLWDPAGDPRKRGADRSSGGYHNCPLWDPHPDTRPGFLSLSSPFAWAGLALTGIGVGLSRFSLGESSACEPRGWLVRPSAALVALSIGPLSGGAPGRYVATIVEFCNDC